MALLFIQLLIVSSIFKCISCERLHGQIYSEIEGGAACFRRLNGTHQAGCSSRDNGAVGVIHMIDNISEAEWLIYNASAGPYMAIVSVSMFNDVIEEFMKNPQNIAGLLLFGNANESVSSFTQESKCPNEYSAGPGSKCSSTKKGDGFVWNKEGSGLLRRDIPFPIFYLPETKSKEVVKIRDCYERFNVNKNQQEGRPLCSLQLNSFMFASVNTEVCLRRSATSALLTPTKVCDPLGDQNIYYSLFPLNNENGTLDKPVTLVTARIDTASLFDGVYPGAASSVVGMVTMISAAALLSKMIPVTDAHLYNQNVLWTLFNGEAFDYIGSQRVAYDIMRGNWPPAAPLLPSDISLHVELGQIGGALLSHTNDSFWPLYAYAPYTSDKPTSVTEFIEELYSYAAAYNISVTAEFNENLPPSSLHSFRTILKNETLSGDLPELLIVDHEDTFTNLFYNSALDDFEKIDFIYHNISIGKDGTFLSTAELIANGTMKESDIQVKISRLATALSNTLFQKLSGKQYVGNLTASAHLVDEMLYCFLRSQACRMLLAAEYEQNAGADEQLPEQPAPLYVGVTVSDTTAPVFAGHLLALLTGTHLDVNQTDCNANDNPQFSTYWLSGWNNSGICVQTTMNFSQAVSPAFIIPGYDLKSGVYSTWTESVWHSLSARVFVSAGGVGAKIAAATGVLITVIVTMLTLWLHRHANVIFNLPTSSVVVEDAATGILRTVNC